MLQGNVFDDGLAALHEESEQASIVYYTNRVEEIICAISNDQDVHWEETRMQHAK